MVMVIVDLRLVLDHLSSLLGKFSPNRSIRGTSAVAVLSGSLAETETKGSTLLFFFLSLMSSACFRQMHWGREPREGD